MDLAPTPLQAQPVFLEAAFTLEGEFKFLSYLPQGHRHLHFISTVIPDLQEFSCDCNLSPFPPFSQRLLSIGHSPQAFAFFPQLVSGSNRRPWRPLASPLSILPPPTHLFLLLQDMETSIFIKVNCGIKEIFWQFWSFS